MPQPSTVATPERSPDPSPAASGRSATGTPAGGSEPPGAFSDRVVVLFAAQVLTLGAGLINGLLLARLLGPSVKGDYTLLVLLPNTLMILGQLGLPQAFGFYSARGRTRTMVAKSIVLAPLQSVGALLAAAAFVAMLGTTLLGDLETTLIAFTLLSLPFLLNANLTTGLVIGRQAVKWYALSNVVHAAVTITLLVVLLGVLGLGLVAALVAFVLPAAIKATVLLVAGARVSRATPNPTHVSYRELFRYGLPFYPGSLTQFFSYRVDIYLLALLVQDPSAPLGYYSVAVGLAELVFFIPDAVSTVFFPHVAGSSPEESARQAPMVSRVTVLMTAAAALLAAPASAALVVVLLPAYLPALPALYVLLPATVAISVTKILSGYVSGLGLPGITSAINVGSFALNVAANLVLIPQFGIVGASAASLLSYTASSVAFSIVAARITHAPLPDFWVPRSADVRYAVSTIAGYMRRLIGRRTAVG
jgi:O-antigen/teichoic acid export membrane protein